MADVEKLNVNAIYNIADQIARNAATAAQSEVEGIRTGTNGTVYASAGEAVRAQIGGLENDVTSIKAELSDLIVINQVDRAEIVTGSMVKATTGVINSDASGLAARTGYIDVSGYAKIKYSRRTLLVTSGVYGMAFYDSNKTYISGVRDLFSQEERGYIDNVVDVPATANYVMMTIWAEDLEGAYLYNAEKPQIETIESQLQAIKSASTFPVSFSDVLTKYIDTRGYIASLTPDNPRLLVIPVEGIFSLNVKITISSTKRYGFCNSLDALAPIIGYTELTGELDATLENDGYKYLAIQLFINSDTEQSAETYINNTTISVVGNTDAYARRIIKNLNNTENKAYHAENLKSLPILDSFADIIVNTAAYNNCAAYHALMKDLCDDSNGFITRDYLGDDGHGNELFKYVTHPKELKFAVDRGEYAPVYPITGGQTVKPLTILLTANIHGREKSGNWVIYNLFRKMLAPDSEMLRFFRNRVRFVCVPYICASGTYNNADHININRDFPTTYDGTCVSNEATYVKDVIDEYGEDIFLHIDIHTFNAGSAQDNDVAGWIFTDSEKLGERCVITAESVLNRYADKYPDIARLGYDYIGSGNIPTTCTYYTQAVYGAPSATMEAALTMDGSPEGTDPHTSAVAYFYDIITQTLCAMVN